MGPSTCRRSSRRRSDGVARNPLRDKLAVVGVGSTPYGRDLQRTSLSLALEAALRAIDDAGIDRQEVDGLCGSGMDP